MCIYIYIYIFTSFEFLTIPWLITCQELGTVMVSIATKNMQRKDALATSTIIVYNEDRISKLPDDILTHILSFLPTKDAIGTIVLSKRWNDLWTFMINLDFDDHLFYAHKRTLEI